MWQTTGACYGERKRAGSAARRGRRSNRGRGRLGGGKDRGEEEDVNNGRARLSRTLAQCHRRALAAHEKVLLDGALAWHCEIHR